MIEEQTTEKSFVPLQTIFPRMSMSDPQIFISLDRAKPLLYQVLFPFECQCYITKPKPFYSEFIQLQVQLYHFKEEKNIILIYRMRLPPSVPPENDGFNRTMDEKTGGERNSNLHDKMRGWMNNPVFHNALSPTLDILW